MPRDIATIVMLKDEANKIVFMMSDHNLLKKFGTIFFEERVTKESIELTQSLFSSLLQTS